MKLRRQLAMMTVTLASAALFALPADAVWCLGTGGGSTGGACGSYDSQAACITTICQQTGGAITDPNCDPNTETCGQIPDPSCSCECYSGQSECENIRNPQPGFQPIKLTNPLGTSDVRLLAARGIQLITGVAGSIALLMFVWGGFMWITSAGNADAAKKAKGIFVNATLGLVIIFGAYAVINALLNAFAGVAS